MSTLPHHTKHQNEINNSTRASNRKTSKECCKNRLKEKRNKGLRRKENSLQTSSRTHSTKATQTLSRIDGWVEGVAEQRKSGE